MHRQIEVNGVAVECAISMLMVKLQIYPWILSPKSRTSTFNLGLLA